MQPVATNGPAPIQQPSLWGPHLTGTPIGTAVGTPEDSDGTPFSYHVRLAGQVGQPDGYASLADATEAVARLTDPESVPAAAILEHDGRFYASSLEAKSVNSWDYEYQWKAFEPNGDNHSFPGEYRFTRSKDAVADVVRAVIDGDMQLY